MVLNGYLCYIWKLSINKLKDKFFYELWTTVWRARRRRDRRRRRRRPVLTPRKRKTSMRPASEQYQDVYKASLVLPNTNGVEIKILPPSALNNSYGKRTVSKKYDQLTQKNTMQIRNKMDLFQYTKLCMKCTSWDRLSALEAESVALSLYPFFYVFMPVVHCRQTLL